MLTAQGKRTALQVVSNSLQNLSIFYASRNVHRMTNLSDYEIPVPIHQNEKDHLISDTMKGIKLVDPRLIDYNPFFKAIEHRTEKLAVIIIQCGSTIKLKKEHALQAFAENPKSKSIADSVKEAASTVKVATGKLTGTATDKIAKLGTASATTGSKSKSLGGSDDLNAKLLKIKEKLPAWQLKIATVLQNFQDYLNNKIQKKPS